MDNVEELKRKFKKAIQVFKSTAEYIEHYGMEVGEEDHHQYDLSVGLLEAARVMKMKIADLESKLSEEPVKVCHGPKDDCGKDGLCCSEEYKGKKCPRYQWIICGKGKSHATCPNGAPWKESVCNEPNQRPCHDDDLDNYGKCCWNADRIGKYCKFAGGGACHESDPWPVCQAGGKHVPDEPAPLTEDSVRKIVKETVLEVLSEHMKNA